MGKKWDYDVPSVDVWRECLRVLKPGGHLLSFAGTRTQHRMAVNIEDAGFEIRDMIAWVYGSGFPKSLNIGKAVDKLQGNERATVREYETHDIRNAGLMDRKPSLTVVETKGTSEFEGWGTALKPALEPITVARKPLEKGLTVAENCLKWGVGGLDIDGCRVGIDTIKHSQDHKSFQKWKEQDGRTHKEVENPNPTFYQGRFPANLIHDGSDEVVSGFPNDTSRFFYCAKASKSERNMGCEGLEERKRDASRHVGQPSMNGGDGNPYNRGAKPLANNHPTVKPLALMRYLCRLVTPPDGVVLDPFCGSGSTLVGALQEGFRYIGIEKDPDYVNIAYARTKHALKEWGRESRQQVLQEVVS